MRTIRKGCLLCAGQEAVLLGYKNNFELVQCNGCALKQVAKLPTAEELEDVYGEWSFNEKYKKYAKRKVYRWLFKLLKLRFLAKGREFLDVGCNVGFACEGARKLGFNATGVELSHGAIKIAKELFPKCEFHSETIQNFAKQKRKFDVVLSSEVIEHLIDVKTFMDSLSSVTNSGGFLYITTPDGARYTNEIDFIHWNEVCPPQHLAWFSKEHLITEFEKRGFEFMYEVKVKKPSLRLVFRKRLDV